MFQIKTQMFTVDESPVVFSRVFSLLILSVLCFGVYYKHEFPSALCEYMQDMMDINTGTNTYTTNCKQPQQQQTTIYFYLVLNSLCKSLKEKKNCMSVFVCYPCIKSHLYTGPDGHH